MKMYVILITNNYILIYFHLNLFNYFNYFYLYHYFTIYCYTFKLNSHSKYFYFDKNLQFNLLILDSAIFCHLNDLC
jgi:hypothetical protein